MTQLSAYSQIRTSAKPQKCISLSSLLLCVDVVVSIVRQMENDMGKRSAQFLTFLLCAAIVSNFGCTTTTHGVRPSQAEMDNHAIGKGDYAMVSDANNDDFGIIYRKRQNRVRFVRCRMHAALMMYANPHFIPVYVADYLKRRKASQ